MELKELLDQKTKEYNAPSFIAADPISIPYKFKTLQDVEISGFFAAILAWGQRKTIINKCTELMDRMNGSPYEFIMNYDKLHKLQGFKHRTFKDTDLSYFVHFLNKHYSNHSSLETAFCIQNNVSKNVKQNLIAFKQYFITDPYFSQRTSKHISTPAANSACKRLNMYLRWMVRDQGIDFGLWKSLKTSQLIIPCDLHVERTIRHLKILDFKKVDWRFAEDLTEKLKEFDPVDPVKYDFALFGMSIDGYIK